jgi:hypothetical protein
MSESPFQQYGNMLAHTNYYRLKNKHSNRYLVIGTFNYFVTAAVANTAMDYFKFDPLEDGRYDIVNKFNRRPRSLGRDESVVSSNYPQYLTVKQCIEQK